MRRTDREITDAEKITQIIQTCHCCRLGFCDNGAGVYRAAEFRLRRGKRKAGVLFSQR